jgi:hypothetical protein
VGDLPVVLPKYTVSQAKLSHLEKARARKAEIAKEKAEERAKQRDETIALSKGVKQVKDPVSREIIKKEVLKATSLRQPKVVPAPVPEQSRPAGAAGLVPPVATPIQKTRPERRPQVVVEDSEPEIIFVKRPKKKIVIEESATESEVEPPKPKSRARARKPRPVETESEYDSEDYVPPPPRLKRQPLKPPTAYEPPRFQINF